jgi:hypothetical protein
MFRIESRIDTSSAEFKENREHMLRLVEELRQRIAEAKKGGPPQRIRSTRLAAN